MQMWKSVTGASCVCSTRRESTILTVNLSILRLSWFTSTVLLYFIFVLPCFICHASSFVTLFFQCSTTLSYVYKPLCFTSCLSFIALCYMVYACVLCQPCFLWILVLSNIHYLYCTRIHLLPFTCKKNLWFILKNCRLWQFNKGIKAKCVLDLACLTDALPKQMAELESVSVISVILADHWHFYNSRSADFVWFFLFG